MPETQKSILNEQRMHSCEHQAMFMAEIAGFRLRPEQPGQYAVKRLVEPPSPRSDQGLFIDTLDPDQKVTFELHNENRQFN